MAFNESLMGTVYHQVDEKGRVRIPSKFFPREEEEDDKAEKSFAMKFYFMAGTQGCISVYLKEALDSRLMRMRNVPDSSEKVANAKRKIMSSIEKVETDKQGRAVIPPALRQYAGINKELVSVGVDDHFEIWSKEVYDKMDAGMSFSSAYDEVGFF